MYVDESSRLILLPNACVALSRTLSKYGGAPVLSHLCCSSRYVIGAAGGAAPTSLSVPPELRYEQIHVL